MLLPYQVSNSFGAALFDKRHEVTPEIKKQLTWKTQNTDSIGVLNVYQSTRITPTENVVVARVLIESAEDQLKGMSFGFSDEVVIYVNDKILHGGSDVYGSRDHQFIGTMGEFDRVYLPLRRGQNEVWFVVKELTAKLRSKAICFTLNKLQRLL